MKKTADLVVYNASELVTLAGPTGRPRTGRQMAELAIIPNGALAVTGQEIAAVGAYDQILKKGGIGPETRVVDAGGCLVTPGLVDAHTHLVFSGSREDEFVLKTVHGVSYLEIEQRGGGIPLTVARTRKADARELMTQARPVLSRMLANGTTTLEAKSGYALNLEGELKLLEVMRALDLEGPMQIVPTLFGTHDVPAEFSDSRDAYFHMVMDELIPEVSRRSLAGFCDSGTAFSHEKTDKLLSAAKSCGMQVKVHADEFAAVGGAELAARNGAVSADHCICSTDEGIRAMAESGVTAVLLPVVPFVHGLASSAPGRRFINAGVPVALGTDFNPSCLNESMQTVMAFSCYRCGLSPAEAITAATINAAYAVGLGDRLGSIEAGKQADLVIWGVDNHKKLPERLGGTLAQTVIKKGRVVFDKEVRTTQKVSQTKQNKKRSFPC